MVGRYPTEEQYPLVFMNKKLIHSHLLLKKLGCCLITEFYCICRALTSAFFSLLHVNFCSNGYDKLRLIKIFLLMKNIAYKIIIIINFFHADYSNPKDS
jgi:hypothetical protein